MPDRSMTMRALSVACLGVALSALFLLGSSRFEGLPGATFFVFGYLVIPVALGIAISIAFPLASERTQRRPMFSNLRFGPIFGARCNECGNSRTRRAQVWVCSLCDESASAFELR